MHDPYPWKKGDVATPDSRRGNPFTMQKTCPYEN